MLFCTGMVQTFAQTSIITVRGTVIDENNVPVIGAYVLCGDNNKTITDVDGRYSISVEFNAVLKFSYMGYDEEEVYVNGRKTIDVKLKPSNTVLPEIVVTSMMDKNAKFIFSPSEMEVVKNHVFLKTRYKIPDKRKHSKKCTFYTLRFGCSFAAVNTIKPQLL